jgi:hypothetical protein
LLGWLSTAQVVTEGAEFASRVVIAEPDHAPVIVAPTQPEDQVRYALEDLKQYLQRITGLKIEVAPTLEAGRWGIFLGDVPANADLKPVIAQRQLGRDGFVLDLSERGVRILGGSKFGTAYGVYEFLERLGVRWLAPGEWGEVVPQQERLSLPAGRFTDKPAFAIREMHTARVGRPFGDWARRQRHNRSGFFGHSGFLPPKRCAREHPDWYAEVDGKRQFDSPANFKLCHSNDAMVRQFVADVLEAIRERKADPKPRSHVGYLHLAADYFILSVSPTDGGGFCRCARCQEQGSVSDRLQRFANTIATAVEREFPGYNVGYYGAYSEHQTAPTVSGRSNVFVYATTWQKSFFHPLSAPINRAFRERLEAFARQCPNLTIRDYDGLAVWWGYGPLTLADVHAEDYRWYHQHGVKGIATEAESGWAPWGYSYYLMSKLWWNPFADIQAIKTDYVKAGYGEAFEPMRRYHERLDKARVYPSPATLYAMRQDLEEAARLARRPDVRRRVDNLRAHYLLLDTFGKSQAGAATPQELQTALRVGKSLDSYVTPIQAKALERPPGEEPKPCSDDELRHLLDQVVITKPRDLAAWSNGDDGRLVPIGRKVEAFPTSLGPNFRYGPHTILIHATAGERIKVWQAGQSRTEYELRGPEQAVLDSGTAEGEAIVDRVATTPGIYTLTFSTGGYRPQIHVATASAVIKAGGARQSLHPFGSATLYFHVPKGTKASAFNCRADEPLELTVWGPHDAPKPVYPRTNQKARVFQEHLIQVPANTDGEVWRVLIRGEDNDLFLTGIPPFLSSDPGRLLVLP